MGLGEAWHGAGGSGEICRDQSHSNFPKKPQECGLGGDSAPGPQLFISEGSRGSLGWNSWNCEAAGLILAAVGSLWDCSGTCGVQGTVAAPRVSLQGHQDILNPVKPRAPVALGYSLWIRCLVAPRKRKMPGNSVE